MQHLLVSFDELLGHYVRPGDHAHSDYFGLIRQLVDQRNQQPSGSPDFLIWQRHINAVYALLLDELRTNIGPPTTPVKFGTSGWRGRLGKDIFVKSVAQVTSAVLALYFELDTVGPESELACALGVGDLAEARDRGCVVGHDNRFGGAILAQQVIAVLTAHGFRVHNAGESTTGVLSAAVMERHAAFSINLTPSHNPLEYGGYKYNAADAGPAAPILTDRITAKARQIVGRDDAADYAPAGHNRAALVEPFNALDTWKGLVRRGKAFHGLDYDRIIEAFSRCDQLVVAIDCVHGASRCHIRSFFQDITTDRLILRRDTADPTFGGIAPEPSVANLQPVIATLQARAEPLKIGVIIDPDGDRIRFTDGVNDISMNRFGAMAYHFLHQVKKLYGMVAKTVATSDFANCLARAFGEETYETRVGFKEFKPVFGRALVCFEESDGISVVGHTPEKDAYIGLLLALDMVLTRKQNLGVYLHEIEQQYGRYFPAGDSVMVSRQGEELRATLTGLERYQPGGMLSVAGVPQRIDSVLALDGRKLILADGSWILIRPSGTESKVRFYVESRTQDGKEALFAAAKEMLAGIGLL